METYNLTKKISVLIQCNLTFDQIRIFSASDNLSSLSTSEFRMTSTLPSSFYHFDLRRS